MIEIDGVSKAYGDNLAVNDVSLTIQPHTICAVVGTSGSGKTTLMRMINRLVEPTSGQIRIDSEDVTAVPAHELRRRIGYAIQGNGLFPHKNVGQNIATVPRLLGWNEKRISARVDELLGLFQLDPDMFRDRMPHELSGGQQQRVGVARALAAKPNILLMDEPFGALDPVIRTKAQDDLLAIQKRFGTTIVLVTHDMEEAIHLGDRIAVMDEGKLVQFAPPAEIIGNPASDFVAELLGPSDRAFRLLSLSRLADHVEPGEAMGEALPSTASLRDAYSELLWSGRTAAPVVTAAGNVIGRIRLESLTRLAVAPK
ncbi:ABC transporter ATP-binding protein [Paracoccus onubensis]|uniref:ABC transporter ATP-binding protein n=1 Tax=Paracoccus onubensis TaxID=1675788 RepID=UPI0027318E17|nr:ABC transporter ATP-binding protein [Paracoccus onubensis]MDP0927765.1 ABC transporter ATP-binding protein [Paracoccus onubensis]